MKRRDVAHHASGDPGPMPAAVVLMSRPRDRGIKLLALGLALLLHAAALMVHLPRLKLEPRAEPTARALRVRRYLPPPPRIERPSLPRGPREEVRRMIPVPDPTPEALEPIHEPEITGDPLGSVEPELLLGEPERPPSAGSGAVAAPGPRLAGVGGVSMPRLIESSRVKPRYPEVARHARLEGRVVLRGVVREDGSVGELELLQCTQPYVGFEESAVEAVRQWRYEPATCDGAQVAVFFTIVVDFSIG